MSGQPPSSSIWWRWSANVFCWLLRLYPRRFREAYGSQMVHDFRDLWEEAALQQGALGVCHVCWETLGDLVMTAIAEQLRKELAMERRIVVRIAVALIWTTAVFEALRILSDNLPLPDRIAGLRYWTYLLFNVMMLVGLVGLVVKYRQRMPRYIWLIGTVAALAYFYLQLLPWLLSLGVRLVWGKDNAPEFAFLNWASLSFSVLVLVGLVGLQIKYHQRMPWYSWLIGSVAALTFCCWEALYQLWSLGALPAVGNKALNTILIGALQNFPVFALPLIFSMGMLVWGVSTLLKGVLPRWIAMLLILFGVDSLLQFPFGGPPVAMHTLSDSVFEAIYQAFRTFPVLVPGTPTTHALYALIQCLLLAGLGYALWVHNRPENAPTEPNAAGPASPSLAEGVDPAI